MLTAIIEVHAPIGRSDPQAVFLANSLCASGFNVILIQCLHKDAAYQVPEGFLNKNVKLISYQPLIPMWSRAATIEYATFCARTAKDVQASLFIAFDFSGQLAIELLEKFSPSTLTIIFQLETIEYTSRFFGDTTISHIARAWQRSLVVYPEPNRFIQDCGMAGSLDFEPLYTAIFPPTVPSQCNFSRSNLKKDQNSSKKLSFIYTGSIVEESFAIEFLECLGYICATNKLNFKVSVAGPIGQSVALKFDNLLKKYLFIEYHGVINQLELAELLNKADYSFVGWKPLDTNFYFSAPNKLFQALSAGVIPISVRSPIVMNLLSSYKNLKIPLIGWTVDDWPKELLKIIQLSSAEILSFSEINAQIFQKSLSWDAKYEDFFKNSLLPMLRDFDLYQF